MVIRILLMLIGFSILVNLVLMSVGLIMNVNLYKTHGKQILNFFIGVGLFVVAVYTILALIGTN